MAEKPEEQFSMDEKAAKAKELYARGCRNYYVKSYSEAADDLSEASKLFGEVHGVDGDELGDVYLLYAKALIATGQEENKVIDVPEDDDDEDEDEPVEEDDGEEQDEADKAPETNGTENGEKMNGHLETTAEEPQPGTSGANENESSNDVPETDEDAEEGGNLELAWEVLQNAAVIFERKGADSLNNLMEVFIEMAGISLENGNFDASIKDFNRALDVFLDLEDADQNPRIAAEVNYKVGLCQTALNLYDDSVKSFKKAADLLSEVIEKEKARPEQTEDVELLIKDLEETKQEIVNKITEIGETKAEEVEQVKKELAKMFGPAAANADGAGSSSSATTAATTSVKSPEADKPKPTDISHLIKRKKPDTDSGVEESPAKKKAVETSPGDKVAVNVTPEAKAAVTVTPEKKVIENVTPETKVAEVEDAAMVQVMEK